MSSSAIGLLCSCCVTVLSRGQTAETTRGLTLRYNRCVPKLSDLLWQLSSISHMMGMSSRSSKTSSSYSRMKPQYERTSA